MGYNGNKGVAPTVVLAAWEGDFDVLRVLLESGADPNRPASAESALYCAIEHTDLDAPDPNKVRPVPYTQLTLPTNVRGHI